MEKVLKYKHYLYLAIFTIIGSIWTYFCITPSSYYQNRINNPKLTNISPPYFGTSQSIRSDEYLVSTPLVQISINNDFERYNNTSPYKEDLRAFSFLPLKDWAIIFKPQMWSFLILQPEYAYAIYFYLILCSFLIGWLLFFSSIGFSHIQSSLLSLTLYSTGYVQYWYAILAPQYAIFPWIYLAAISNLNFIKKTLLLSYLLLILFFSSYYTINLLLLIGSLFILIIALITFERVKSITIHTIISLIISSSIYFLYVFDSLAIISNTIYPGLRRIDPLQSPPYSNLNYLSYLFPNIFILEIPKIGTFSLGPDNLCEIGVLGSYLILNILFFCSNFKALKSKASQFRSIIMLSACCFLLYLVVSFSLPSYLYKLPVLNNIPAKRWTGMMGLLLFIVATLAYHTLELRLNLQRLLTLLIFYICVISIIKINILPDIFWTWQDVAFPSFLIAAFIVSNLSKINHKTILLSAIALSNLSTFGTFNPIQSAKGIFNLKNDATINKLKLDPQNFTKKGFYIGPEVGGGAINNAAGLKSIGHVLMTPNLKFFSHYFSQIDEDKFNWIFNRFAHIRLLDRDDNSIYCNSNSPKVEPVDERSYKISNLKKYDLNGDCIFAPQENLFNPTDSIFLPKRAFEESPPTL